MSKLTERIAALAAPVAAAEGCSVWDVEYGKEAGTWYLRCYLDRPGGVDLALCERVSRRLGELLDEADPIAEPYVFEVSSPGADRELKRPSDFERFMGQRVTVKLYRAIEGKKEQTGTLCAYENGDLIIRVGEETLRLLKKDIAQVRLYVEW